MKKHWVFLLTAALVLAFLTGPATAAREVRFGHVAPPFHGQNQGSLAFAKYVEEKTKGEIVVKVFPMGQLGGETSMAEQVQGGTLEMSSITTAVLQNFVPECSLLDLPFVWPNRETAYGVLGDKEFQDRLFSFFPKKGFVAIGYTENEFRDLTNSKRPIHKPEDMKGLKIRVMKSPVYLDAFSQVGANPVGLPFPEIYSALQQGVIDGQENPIYTSILIKVPEVNKYATLTKHILTECLIVLNVDFWESLTPEQQQIFREASDLCIKVNREVNAEHEKKLPNIDKSIDEYLKDAGVEVVRLTDEERALWAQAMRPVWEKYRQSAGPDFYDFFMKKIEQYKK